MEKLLFAALWGGAMVGLGIAAWRSGARGVAEALVRGTAWGQEGQEGLLSARVQALLWLVHAGGLAYVWRLNGQAYREAMPLGAITAAVLLLPQLPALRHGRRLDITPLNALVAAYAVAALWGLHVLPGVIGQTTLQSVALGSAGYVVLLQVQRWWRLGGGLGAVPVAIIPVLVVTLAWALLEYVGGRTRGLTGSDPFCYGQMAVDVARRADPRHVYTLLPLVRDTSIPWWPIVHVGYYPPDGATGLAPTVWPVGWPVLLAVAYRLLGESGLYVGAPVAGLLSLGATVALLLEVWPPDRPPWRWLGVALVAIILGTSREQVLRLLVPMADVPTQLFTVLAMWLALRAGRTESAWLAGLAGAALGVAYDMRHTQVFLLPVVALALCSGCNGSRRWLRIGMAGLGAGLVAAPDLWYHSAAFGSIWRPESPELNLIGAGNWWRNAQLMVAAALQGAEFGLLLPFLGYGLWRLGHSRTHAAAVLVSWVAVNAGSQLLYGPLRWRDLLSIVPPLAILSAYGAVAMLARLRSARPVSGWAPGWLGLGLAVLLALRSGPVVAWPLQKGEMIFGYLTAEQRRAFDVLAQSVEKQAVVGTSLNSGPVELYTGREAFRPGAWNEAQLEAFLGAMVQAGKPVYFLDDGGEHAAVVARLREQGRLEPIGTLNVPFYGDRSQLTGVVYRYKVRNKP